MNTKHTRVVVTLFVAFATLATMGFSIADRGERAASVLPDHLVCALVEPSFAALERPDLINDSCYPALIDMVEYEIGWAFGGQASTQSLIDSIYARSSSTDDTAYLELLESESGMYAFEGNVEPPVALSGRSASVNTSAAAADNAYLDLLQSEAGMDTFAAPVASSSRSASANTSAAPVDNAYLDLLQSEAGMDAFAAPVKSPLPSAARQESFASLSGPSPSDVPLDSVYTHAGAKIVTAPDSSTAKVNRRVGFDGPSAKDVPLLSVYTHN